MVISPKELGLIEGGGTLANSVCQQVGHMDNGHLIILLAQARSIIIKNQLVIDSVDCSHDQRVKEM
jgi:hypothetical protein